MSTQNKQTSTGQFDPTSMGVYQGLQSQFGNAISSEINNPYGNMAFNTQLGMMRQQQGASGASQNQATLQRMQAMGVNPQSAFFQSQMGKNQRQQMASTGQGYNNLLLQAQQLRQSAIGQAGSYRPLQTGSTQVQQQSGVGSWLPQVLGGALGIAGGAMTGGMSSMFGGGGGGGMGAFSMGGGQNPSYGGSDYFNGGMNGAAPGAGTLYNPNSGPANPFFGGGQ